MSAPLLDASHTTRSFRAAHTSVFSQ